MTVVCAHQLNFAPGVSVMNKIGAADICVWEDELEFTRGYEHRNRLPNGKWITVPVEYGSVGEPLNRVRIARDADSGRGWRKPMADAVMRAWDHPAALEVAAEIMVPHRQLLGLNVAVMEILFRHLGLSTKQRFQSLLEAGHVWPGGEFKSERLAAMVAEVGGTTYLSGPSGRRYLDERPFHERGLAVEYWEYEGPNPCALELLRERVAA